MRQYTIDIIEDFIDWWVEEKENGKNYQFNKAQQQLNHKKGNIGGLSFSLFKKERKNKWDEKDMDNAFEKMCFYNFFIFQNIEGRNHQGKYIKNISKDEFIRFKITESVKNDGIKLVDVIQKHLKEKLDCVDIKTIVSNNNEIILKYLQRYFKTDEITLEDVGDVNILQNYAMEMNLSEDEFLHMSPREFVQKIKAKTISKESQPANYIIEKYIIEKYTDMTKTTIKNSKNVNIGDKKTYVFSKWKLKFKFLDKLKKLFILI